MARRRSAQRYEHARLKSAVFLAFSLALFTGMYFIYGKLDREWRGVIEINVLFSEVNKIHPLAPVLYDGMELGRVKSVKIVRATPELLKALPKIERRDLEYLPLSDNEIGDMLDLIPEDRYDAVARKLIAGRSMVMATLTMLIEQDEQRLHKDDRYYASSGYLGESSIELVSGNLDVVPPRPGLLFLGAKQDLMSDIDATLKGVSERMGSVARAIVGSENQKKLHGHLRDIDTITLTILEKTRSIADQISDDWNGIDEAGDSATKRLNDLIDGIVSENPDKLGLKGRVDAALKVTKSKIGAMHADLSESTSEADKWIKTYRTQITDQVQEFRRYAADGKTKVPPRLKQIRGYTENALAAVKTLDDTLDEYEHKFADSTENAHVYTGAQTEPLMKGQETLWHFKNSPASLKGGGTAEQLAEKHRAWRYDMIRKQYQEMRRELASLQGDMGVGDPAERERARHVEQLLSESDDYFGINRGEYPVVVSPPRPPVKLPNTEIRTGEPIPVPAPAEVIDLKRKNQEKK